MLWSDARLRAKQAFTANNTNMVQDEGLVKEGKEVWKWAQGPGWCHLRLAAHQRHRHVTVPILARQHERAPAIVALRVHLHSKPPMKELTLDKTRCSRCRCTPRG